MIYAAVCCTVINEASILREWLAFRDALGSIHADLAAHDLLPDTHLVDTGYVDADLLLASTRAPRRLLTPRRCEEHAASETARAREVDEAFAEQYRWRAGIEGTLSLGVRTLHLRRAR
ncbi:MULTISPECIES: hypothetical protein [Methylobacterium]|uniref:hypothetical protein n=1 Tax=Methylobacterium TaxID=407 RepID=UPI0013ED3A69|nr:hypothetical protein [Methylobacterium sp. DB0501]NGM38666.1 hypothetical protein [Methylobacterium sp. DB0501]